MFWKGALLLALTAPLACGVWREIAASTRRAVPRLNMADAESLAAEQSAVLRARNTQQTLDEQWVLALQPYQSVGKRIEGATQVARAAIAYTELVQDVMRFARLHRELEIDARLTVTCSDAELRRHLEERRGTIVRLKETSRQLLLRQGTQSEKLLQAVRARDADSLMAARDAQETLLIPWRQHREACKGFAVLSGEVDGALAATAARRDFLEALLAEKGPLRSLDKEDLLHHLGRLARAMDSGPRDPELIALVRAEARRFCEAYLPQHIDGDEKVMYRGRPVPREQIWILWKPNRPEAKRYGNTVRLTETPFDEVRPPSAEAIEHYFRRPEFGDDTFLGPLTLTPLNRAARHYNESRKNLTWNAAALRKLLDQCPIMWSEKQAAPEAYQRAEALLPALERCFALFQRDD